LPAHSRPRIKKSACARNAYLKIEICQRSAEPACCRSRIEEDIRGEQRVHNLPLGLLGQRIKSCRVGPMPS